MSVDSKADGSRHFDEKLLVGTSSPLMVACGHGRITDSFAEFIKILADAGADVNQQYTAGEGPLATFTVLSIICSSRTAPDDTGVACT